MSLNETEVTGINVNVENKTKKGAKIVKPNEVKKNIGQQPDSNLKGETTKVEQIFPEVTKTLNDNDKTQTRTNILYNLHRKISRHRQDLQTKGELERVQKDFSECTFAPQLSLTDNYKKLYETSEKAKNTANEIYVEKKKKQRETFNILENQSKNKIGSGNNWTRELTIPNDFKLKTLSRSGFQYSTMNNFSMDMKDNKNDNLKNLLDQNKIEGLKIYQLMKYDEAVSYLHSVLHDIQI